MACSTHPRSAEASSRACRLIGRWPDSVGAPTDTWSRTPPCSGSTSGVWRVSSSTRSQPSRAAACSASSSTAGPGTTAVPSTRCSPSQGWADSDRCPVSSSPSAAASSVAAPSRGCPAASSPAAPTSPVGRAGGSQYRRRWNG